MALAVVLLAAWTLSVLNTGRCCPELCTCSRRYNTSFVDCASTGFAEIPSGLPPAAMTVSLSANRIGSVPTGIFDNVTEVRSLWLAHNRIVSVEDGSIAALTHLRNLDISYNLIGDFAWRDLQNLTALQLLKLNHNRLVSVPRDALSGLRELRSLRLNNNRLSTMAEGTLDGLVSLSDVQIFSNPFACTCSLDWLRRWILTTTVAVMLREAVICATPEVLKGKMLVTLPESKCSYPRVAIRRNSLGSDLRDDGVLVLTCEFQGEPDPEVTWTISSQTQRQQLALSSASEDSLLANDTAKALRNGTLIVSPLRADDSGNYSCSAVNELGKAEDVVSVEVLPLATGLAVSADSTPRSHQTKSVFELARNLDSGALAPSQSNPGVDAESVSPLPDGKCGVTANTRFVSSPMSNKSADDIRQYTFDFGVIALGVSETEVTVRLNPLLIPKDLERSSQGGSSEEDPAGSSEASGKAVVNVLYLCVTNDRTHSAVQWSRIQDGVDTYRFSNLRPSTNYSLCLTYQGDDCEVQVLFATRRKVTNLLIIISVSICLLTVSTVPLLVATCFHLVYKYRSKTYKLIMKAKDQCHIEGSFSLRAPHTESQRRINGSQLDGDGGEEEEEEEELERDESVDREPDTEESLVTESFTLSVCRGALDQPDDESECSDRLPLGAEAVNITARPDS